MCIFWVFCYDFGRCPWEVSQVSKEIFRYKKKIYIYIYNIYIVYIYKLHIYMHISCMHIYKAACSASSSASSGRYLHMSRTCAGAAGPSWGSHLDSCRIYSARSRVHVR